MIRISDLPTVTILPSKYGWDSNQGRVPLLEKDGDEYLVLINGREVWFNRCRIKEAD